MVVRCASFNLRECLDLKTVVNFISQNLPKEEQKDIQMKRLASQELFDLHQKSKTTVGELPVSVLRTLTNPFTPKLKRDILSTFLRGNV